ncbi:MAG: thioredoxin family protein [Odoribacter sp.]|nr:thioredoxin family protein [Odoribacter sp.]
MKQWILWTMLCTVPFVAWSQEGVKFESLTFEQALSKAQTEGKVLFVDCYTSWCGPCKHMSEKVFPQARMGEFFNPRFVSVKYDMEQPEGKQFGERYSVTAYPTFFLIAADGTLLHKVIGGFEADELIRHIREGLEGGTSLGQWEQKYKSGHWDKEFLWQYLGILQEAREEIKIREIAEELLDVASEEEKVSKEYWSIFGNPQCCPLDSKAFAYLIAHRERFYPANGRETVDKRLTEPLRDEVLGMMEGVQAGAVERLDEVEKKLGEWQLLNVTELLAAIKIARSVQTDGIDRLLDVCEQEIPRLEKDGQLAMWTIFRLSGSFVQYTSGPLSKATADQKARWEKIIRLERN